MTTSVFRAALLVTCTWSFGASAAVVDDVYDLAYRTARAGPPPAAARTLALVSRAMFDAANAIDRRYQPYRPQAAPTAGASADAAALGAACAVLTALQPPQQANVAVACDAIAAKLAPAAGIADGRRYGAQVGEALVAARRGDGLGAESLYRPAAAPGGYVATPLPVGYDQAFAMPLALSAPSQFRPGPPPALASDTWARDFNEVKTLGGRASTQRTPAQTETAFFWASNGPQQFVDSLGAIRVDTATGTTDRARMLALAYMAIIDAGIAVMDAKYAYDFWRPLTAIRNGDRDGNDATERDAGWLPLIDTPLHPEYPCAHCTVTAALGAVLAAYFGEGEMAAPFALRSASGPGRAPTARQWRRIEEMTREIQDARVWSGVHYRNSAMAGGTLGRNVGVWVVTTQLRPVTAK